MFVVFVDDGVDFVGCFVGVVVDWDVFVVGVGDEFVEVFFCDCC